MTASAPPPYAPQPYPYGPPPMQRPQPPSDPGGLFRLLAGIFGALTAVLVVVGSFLPQTTFEQIVSGKTESSQTISAWSRSFGVEPDAEAQKFYENTHVAHYGIPLSVAAAVLLVGAGLAFAGARRSAGPGVRSGARTALLTGGAGAAAAVWMLGMDVSATLSYESDDASIKSHYATGTGFWLLLGAGVLALAALAFALLAGRRVKAPAGPPPGPYGGPGYPQQQSRPYPVPPQQSGGYPVSQPFPAQPGAQQSQPFPAQQPYGGPSSQPFPAQQPYGGPQSQPFPAQQPADPFPAQQPADPFPAQQPAEPLEATQAQPHPGEQQPAAEPASPTEPTYQLPPLNPPLHPPKM